MIGGAPDCNLSDVRLALADGASPWLDTFSEAMIVLERSPACLLLVRRSSGAVAVELARQHANVVVENGRLVGVRDAGGFGPADPALDLVSACPRWMLARATCSVQHSAMGT